MQFVYLLLLALVWLQTSWPAAIFDWPAPEGSGILVVAIVIVSWLSAWVMANFVCWQMTRHPEYRITFLRRFARWRTYHFLCILVAYLACLYVLGWGHSLLGWWTTWCPDLLRSEGNLPGFQVGLIVPFFLALVAAWERFYSVEKTAYELVHAPDRFIPKGNYLLMQARYQLFMVLPPCVLMVSMQFLYLLSPEDENSWLPSVIMTGFLAIALIMMPVVLRVFLGLTPLPAGPLRDRLENAARRLGFGYSNVLVWHTRKAMANALVTGFVPWVRYIVLTDKLIEELTPEEIEAVFGHEVGHIKHHHLLFYLAFFLTSFVLISVFWKEFRKWPGVEIGAWLELLPAEWGVRPTLATIGKLTLLAGYTLLCFGFVSRRCERQADLFGADTVSTDTFISALEKVAAINGIPRDRTGNWLLGWQHPTIGQRIDFLMAMRDDPLRVPSFHRSIFLLKWSFYLALGFLIYWFGWRGVWDMLKDF